MILRMPGGGNPVSVTPDEWLVVQSHVEAAEILALLNDDQALEDLRKTSARSRSRGTFYVTGASSATIPHESPRLEHYAVHPAVNLVDQELVASHAGQASAIAVAVCSVVSNLDEPAERSPAIRIFEKLR